MNMYEGLKTCGNRYCSLLLEATMELIAFFDEQGRIIGFNSVLAKELGYGDALYGMQINEVFHTSLQFDEQGNVIPENLEKTEETVIYRKNKTCFDAEVKISLWNQKEETVGICTAVSSKLRRDMERQVGIAQESVKQSQKIQNEFVANVTHELRTPLNGIIGHTKELLDTELTQEQKKMLDIIGHCSENMLKIINNLLDFSKLQVGKFVLDNRPFNFRQFIDNLIATHIPKVNEKDLKLLVKVADDVPSMLIGDELALTQILNNLLSNAIKFTSIGQVLLEVIKTQEIDNKVELFFMVIDSGIGISDEEKEKLFKSFSQVDASITREFGGTGLGLAICKQFVELMHGDIHVESQKGKGSTFSFHVTLEKAEESEDVQETKLVYSQYVVSNNTQTAEAEKFSDIYQFGNEENLASIKTNFEKLLISVEMNNWDKAELFAQNLKQLLAEAELGTDKILFRLTLNLRKENYEKSIQLCDELKEILGTIIQI